MTTTALLQEAASYQEQLVRTRRFLHTHPGTGFDIQETVDYVKQELISMGYEPQMCGKSGIVALAGKKKDGKVFLIRGDMDALPMKPMFLFPPPTAKCTPAVMICTLQ